MDANIMLAVGIRRLLCAMQELTGGAVWVTPRVWHEVWERCADTSLKVANKAERRKGGMNGMGHRFELGDAEKRNANDVARRYTAGWRRWMRGEDSRSDSSWHFLKKVEGADRMHFEVLASGGLTDNDGKVDDSWVVAEAMLSGAHILASHDTGTIKHEVLNAWVEKMKVDGHPLFRKVPRNFAMRPDDAVAMICKEQRGFTMGDAGLRWAVAACRPDKTLPRDALPDIVKRFMKRNRGHMPVTTAASMSRLDDLLANDPDWYDTINNYPLAPRTRATEARFRDELYGASPIP